MNIKGLYAPLVTPFYKGEFDAESMQKLVSQLEPFVDGFVPCLSSGEGQKLRDDVWFESVRVVRASTKKPVFAGVLRAAFEDVVMLSRMAKELDCNGVVIPTVFVTDKENLAYFEQLSKAIELPMLVYNAESHPFQSAEAISKLATIPGVIGLKDSSGNQQFFDEVVQQGKLPILQGMENQLTASLKGAGFLISLANVEPELCRKAYFEPSSEVGTKLESLWYEYNLANTWFISMKALLFGRGIICSAEEVS